MNKVFLTGRITKDIELRETEKYKVTRFTLAVDRKKDETDFISCSAWDRTAELLSVYCAKGSRIAIAGRIQTGSYTDRNGEKKYTIEVVADSIEFLDPKKQDKVEPDKVDDENLPF